MTACCLCHTGGPQLCQLYRCGANTLTTPCLRQIGSHRCARLAMTGCARYCTPAGGALALLSLACALRPQVASMRAAPARLSCPASAKPYQAAGHAPSRSRGAVLQAPCTPHHLGSSARAARALRRVVESEADLGLGGQVEGVDAEGQAGGGVGAQPRLAVQVHAAVVAELHLVHRACARRVPSVTRHEHGAHAALSPSSNGRQQT